MEFLFEGGPACAVILAGEQLRHAALQIHDEPTERRLEARAIAGGEAQRARPVRLLEIEHIGDVRRRRHGGGQPLQGPAHGIALARPWRPGHEQVESRLRHPGRQVQRPHGAVLAHRPDRLGQAGRALEGQPCRVGDQPQPVRLQGLHAHSNSPRARRSAPFRHGPARCGGTKARLAPGERFG